MTQMNAQNTFIDIYLAARTDVPFPTSANSRFGTLAAIETRLVTHGIAAESVSLVIRFALTMVTASSVDANGVLMA